MLSVSCTTANSILLLILVLSTLLMLLPAAAPTSSPASIRSRHTSIATTTRWVPENSRQRSTTYRDTHSHVLKYTEVWRILLLMAWLLASPPTTLAYSLTHSTPHGATHTTTLSTTSYPYALTMVVPVCLCVLVSLGMCIPVGLCVGGCASAIGRSRLQYFLVLHPE